jgi:hypothetical protein
VIAGFHGGEQRVGHGGHAGAGGAAGLRAFEEGEAALEHLHGGVLEARVGGAGLVSAEAGGGLFGAIVGEAGGEEESFGGFAEFGAHGAAADGERCGAPARGDGGILACGFLHAGVVPQRGTRGKRGAGKRGRAALSLRARGERRCAS